ncbi:hypothetical protein D9757_013127 [Collybiopsis confluens]|uniref:Uncharacterized protein n=1 Tax=Collybiopsis confluens TaxID=2823264 RepID=A0A8H5LUG0_9AGAR|nr:hypothetical protein D9757_013127 [Collybiopsis confluens]
MELRPIGARIALSEVIDVRLRQLVGHSRKRNLVFQVISQGIQRQGKSYDWSEFIDVLDILDGHRDSLYSDDDDDNDRRKAPQTLKKSTAVAEEEEGVDVDSVAGPATLAGNEEDDEETDNTDDGDNISLSLSDAKNKAAGALDNLQTFLSPLLLLLLQKAQKDGDRDQPKKRRTLNRIKERTEAIVENELRTQSAVQPSSASISKKKKPNNISTLPVPLPQRTQDQLNRQAAYEETKRGVDDKWSVMMKRIREADFWSFPLQEQQQRQRPHYNQPPRPVLDTENAILKNTLSVDEVEQKRRELRWMRELLFRAEVKAGAFAGNNVIKVRLVSKMPKSEIYRIDAPTQVDTTLPGLGSWGGPGIQKTAPKPYLIKKVAGIDPKSRSDYNKSHVIISKKRDKKAASKICLTLIRTKPSSIGGWSSLWGQSGIRELDFRRGHCLRLLRRWVLLLNRCGTVLRDVVSIVQSNFVRSAIISGQHGLYLAGFRLIFAALTGGNTSFTNDKIRISAIVTHQIPAGVEDPAHDDFELWSPSESRTIPVFRTTTWVDSLCFRQSTSAASETPTVTLATRRYMKRRFPAIAPVLRLISIDILSDSSRTVNLTTLGTRTAVVYWLQERHLYPTTKAARAGKSSGMNGQRIGRFCTPLVMEEIVRIKARLTPAQDSGGVNIRLPADTRSGYYGTDNGILATLASVPWFLVGLAGIAWEYVASNIESYMYATGICNLWTKMARSSVSKTKSNPSPSTNYCDFCFVSGVLPPYWI